MSGLTSRFEVAITSQLGADLTPDVHAFWQAWQAAEGGTAAHNPFNTEQYEPGSTNYNSVGVKNYPSEDVGIRATVTTLTNGYYGGIIAAVRDGRDAMRMATAVAQSPWGTGAGVLTVLRNNGYKPSATSTGTTTGGLDMTEQQVAQIVHDTVLKLIQDPAVLYPVVAKAAQQQLIKLVRSPEFDSIVSKACGEALAAHGG